MNLTDGAVTTPRLVKTGSQVVELTAGKGIQIRTKTPVVDILDVDVPVGKKWSVAVFVEVTETDA